MNQRRVSKRRRIGLGIGLFFLVLSSYQLAGAIPEMPKFFGPSPIERMGLSRFLQSGEFEQAKNGAELLLESDPENPALFLILGYAEAGIKHWDAALINIKQAIRHSRGDNQIKLRVDLGNIYALSGQPEKAQGLYQEVLAKQPENLRAIRNLGDLFLQSGKKKKAVAQYQKVLRIHPENQEAIKILIRIHMGEGNYDAVLPLARKLRTTEPNPAAGYFMEALALVRKKKPDYPAAISLLKTALKSSTEKNKIQHLLGFIYLKSGKEAEGLRHLKKVLARDAGFFEAHKLLGAVLLKQNKAAEAAKHLESALSIRKMPEVYHLLGQAYLASGKKAAGLELLNQSLEGAALDQNDRLAAEGLYAYLGGHLEESERKLIITLKEDPNRYETRILLIVNLLNRGKNTDAVAVAKAGLKQHAKAQKLLLNLMSQAYLAEGKLAEADEALRKALKEDPDFTTTRINLSAVYFHQAAYDKAEQELAAVLKKAPQHRQAGILLGRVYQAIPDNKKAEAFLQAQLQSEPTDPGLLKEFVLLQIRMRHFEKAMDYADQYTALYPEAISGYLLQARVHASKPDFPRTFKAIDQGLAEVGENRTALAIGSRLALLGAQPALALRYLERYRDHFGLQSTDLQQMYVKALLHTGKHQEARNYAVKSLPEAAPQTAHLIGLTWAMQGNPGKAEGYFKQAIQDRSFDEAFFDLARIKLALGKPAEAVALLKSAIKANPQEEKYYLTLGLVYEGQSALKDAVAIYKKGISTLRNNTAKVPLLNNIALAYLKKNDKTRSISYAKKALDLAPHDPNVLDTLGWIYFKMNEAKLAVPYLEQASRALPELALFRYHLGMSYYKSGQMEKAREALEQSLLNHQKASRQKAPRQKVPWASEVKALLAAISKS